MSTAFSFQNQLSSIMDALSKTVVLEISKLVEIESKMLKIEINRGRNEISSLTDKLQLMEKLLYMQGKRQDFAVVAMVRDRGLVLQPDRTTQPAINSSQHPGESPRDAITSSTTEDTNIQQRVEPSQSIEHPVLEPDIVIKEEPIEEQCGVFENRSKCESVNPVIVIAPVKSEVDLCPPLVRQVADSNPSLITDGFNNTNSQSPQVGSESLWNVQPPSACTNLENENPLSQNTASFVNNLGRNVKIHTLRNSSTKKFGCLQCGKSFRCFSQLEIHQRSHTGEKPFRCTLCGKKYAQKGHLYTHQRTHTGEKPYRCPICAKGFIQKCTLDMHQRTHTGEKPFICIKCGKGFTKNCNLKKHLAVHLDASLHIYSSDSAPTFTGTFINRMT